MRSNMIPVTGTLADFCNRATALVARLEALDYQSCKDGVLFAQAAVLNGRMGLADGMIVVEFHETTAEGAEGF